MIEAILGLAARLVTLGIEAANASKEQSEEINAKFKAALAEAAAKADHDFSASDAAFLEHVSGTSRGNAG